jgi:hypothetical protein
MRGPTLTLSYLSPALALAVALALSGCAASSSSDASASASDQTASPLPSGFYELASSSFDGFRWINRINLRDDGTFEASLGDGVSSLSGHEFSANGTFSVSSSSRAGSTPTLTLHYEDRGNIEEQYAISSGTDGAPRLRFRLSDGTSDGEFALRLAPTPATIRFDPFAASPSSPRLEGKLRPGAPVIIEYAAGRDQCPISTGGTSVYLFGTGDSGPAELAEAFPPKPVNGLFRLSILAPNGRTMALWIQNETVGTDGSASCVKWDSSFGHNYTFDLE